MQASPDSIPARFPFCGPYFPFISALIFTAKDINLKKYHTLYEA